MHTPSERNTNRHMQNQIGYPESDRIQINDAIFGKNGITTKTDVDTFGYRLNKLISSIEEKDDKVGDKKFMPYFENKLLPLLKQHVIEPVKTGKVSAAWTNNNCESANHVLKTATKWKIQDMPNFIEKLYSIKVTRKKCVEPYGRRVATDWTIDINITRWTLASGQLCL